ncbi:MAG: fimbria major subunit [Bacteroidales bacterium]|nr:fimbria major subunit [Bacteroidales bacterium]
MKNKILFFIIGLCVISFVACEKAPSNIKSEGNLNIKVDTDNNFVSPRDSESLLDAGVESKISSLRVFLIKSDLSDLEELEPAGSTPEKNKYSYSDGRVTVDLSYTYKGDWKVLVIANWPDALTLDTSSYADLKASVYSGLSSSDMSALWTDDHFLMVGKSDVDVTLSNLISDKDNPIEITSRLERVAVKVTAETSEDIIYGLIGQTMAGSDAVWGISRADILGAALVNRATSFNLFSKFEDGVPVTATSPIDYPISGYTDTDPSSLVYSDLNTPMYCLENNSPLYFDLVPAADRHLDAAEESKMKGRVTGVVFKVRVKMLSQFRSEADSDPSGEDLVLDPEEGVWTKAAGDDDTDAKYATFYRYRGICYADLAWLLACNPDLGLTESQATVAALRAKNVSVYEDGYMYYTYWIDDPSYGLAVIRNTWYRLYVDSIAAFGNDQPCEGDAYDAEDPLLLNPSKISVTMKVADWEEKNTVNYTLN